MGDPVNKVDANGKYFVTTFLTENDLKNFQQNNEKMCLSEHGKSLYEQLSNAKYPIYMTSAEIIGDVNGFASVLLKDESTIGNAEVTIDFSKFSNNLKTQIEEFSHIKQYDDAKNKAEYDEKTHDEHKKKAYKDRSYEKEAKENTKIILQEIDNEISNIKSQPKVFNNQLPRTK